VLYQSADNGAVAVTRSPDKDTARPYDPLAIFHGRERQRKEEERVRGFGLRFLPEVLSRENQKRH